MIMALFSSLAANRFYVLHPAVELRTEFIQRLISYRPMPDRYSRIQLRGVFSDLPEINECTVLLRIVDAAIGYPQVLCLVLFAAFTISRSSCQRIFPLLAENRNIIFYDI